MNAQVLLGTLSGLRFLDPNLPLATLVPTMVVVNALDAIMCRLFAHNNGYSAQAKNVWTVLGFAFGIWAMAVLIVLPKRGARP